MSEFYCVKCDSDREHCECERSSIGAYKEIPPAWIVQELWGLGLTIIPRAKVEKVFDLAKDLAPAGMAYQWNEHLNAAAKVVGWKCIPASRHPGLFMPYGYTGDIEVNGLWLMERSKAEVDSFHAEAHVKARQNVDDWMGRQAQAGFTGGVTMLSEGSDSQSAEVSDIGGGETNRTKIPKDMYGYLPSLMLERDVIFNDLRASYSVPDTLTPTDIIGLRVIALDQAIENIRKKIATERAQHEQSTNSSGDGTADQAQAGTPENGTS